MAPKFTRQFAAEFISVEAWIAHYVAGACPTSLSAGLWLATEFISVEAWIAHYVADQIAL